MQRPEAFARDPDQGAFARPIMSAEFTGDDEPWVESRRSPLQEEYET